MKKIAIKDFLIIDITGKNDSIGIRKNSNFFKLKIQTKIKHNEIIVNKILDFLNEKEVIVDKNFSIIVNQGPGSFSSIRTSLAIAKGIKISKGVRLYGYNNSNLTELNLKNIEFLINENLLENKLIKPVYIS